MITNETIAELHTLRKKVCTCNKAFMTPDFHEIGCPYVGQGGDHILNACNAPADTEGGDHE